MNLGLDPDLAQMEIPSPIKMGGGCVYSSPICVCVCDVRKQLNVCQFWNQVWQMEWDMSGMTLATTGNDGMVRLWQANLNGVWHEQAAFEPTS